MRVPKELRDAWRDGYKKRKVYISRLVTVALHFALYGPHPYDDPVDGVEDAFRRYMEHYSDSHERRAQIIEGLARQLGVEVLAEALGGGVADAASVSEPVSEDGPGVTVANKTLAVTGAVRFC